MDGKYNHYRINCELHTRCWNVDTYNNVEMKNSQLESFSVSEFIQFHRDQKMQLPGSKMSKNKHKRRFTLSCTILLAFWK